MNLCDCCKSWETCALAWRGKVNFPGEHCTGLAFITRSDLAARDAEIADLKRGVVVVPERAAWLTVDEMANALVLEFGTPLAAAKGFAKAIADASMAKGSRAIPADRELMRLVDELIRWHGLRPLDKRPDHAAALVGAINALRAQPTQEPTT